MFSVCESIHQPRKALEPLSGLCIANNPSGIWGDGCRATSSRAIFPISQQSGDSRIVWGKGREVTGHRVQEEVTSCVGTPLQYNLFVESIMSVLLKDNHTLGSIRLAVWSIKEPYNKVHARGKFLQKELARRKMCWDARDKATPSSIPEVKVSKMTEQSHSFLKWPFPENWACQAIHLPPT